MARPAFALSDAAARDVMLAAHELEARYPDSQHNADFLEEFIRATHRATGRLVGVPSIQRLLRAYAPARRPSTATILAVKKRVEASLQDAPPAAELPSVPLEDSPRRRAARGRVALRGPDDDPTALRLLALELEDQRRRRQAAEVECARLSTVLRELYEELSIAEGRARASEQALADLATRVEELAATTKRALEMEAGSRHFALQAIEAARAESRTWRERYEGVEALRQQERALLESYRQQASRGRP